ncbi:hypothetical protein ETU08_06555 [Apibacter muscae]|uniref:hypothetical protein n=1 Tax=Apibacter muscae TaxID=2509004 RepID=UPI0011AD559E|nr:hypothetical protein [Apibacter muscae]TWP30215.1 hypothetical protein ETU08_06555 [Apibacter muscae]
MKEEDIVQIRFFCKDDRIAEAEYLSVEINEGLNFLNIVNLKLNKNFSLSHFICNEVIIKIYLKGKLMLLTCNSLTYEVKDDSTIIFKLNEIYTDEIYTFNQDYLDVFYGWQNGREYTWRDFKDKEEKESWLRCCCFWSGVPHSLGKMNNYILKDEELLKTPLDLHCLLSEVFFGKRGYFGSEINAFIDCLINIQQNAKDNFDNIKVIINNYDDINKKMSRNIGYENYLIQISMELEKHGLQVITN